MKLKQHDKLKDINKEAISWDDYYEEVKPLLGLRETGFTKTFEYLRRIKEPVIVETGTVREDYNFEGDGCSTILFDNYIDKQGGKLITIDIDPAACKNARTVTTHAEVIEADSVEYLSTLEGHVDLLYLDSFNIYNWLDDWEASGHHLKELFAAKNIIKEGTLIVVDDNLYMKNTDSNKKFGKGRMIHEMMKSIGIPPYIDGYHMGWIWEEVA
jgi:cephalosporin hydroxylase|tara:strand:+ start:719 stop:1357 length:639 start_codon:yes stop_codon:yes gene_type:complete